MKQLRFYFDVVSPYAYLAFERLPQALVGLSVEVSYQPVLFAGLLAHWGNLGPAEIQPKRAWTYRQVAWLAHRQGVRLDLPAQHPFNPLALLRLALACVPEAGEGARLVTPSRRVCERLFHHVWHSGEDANDAQRLAALHAALQPVRDPHGNAVRNALREATTAAAERGVFGVPAIEVDGRMFWGLDSIDMLAAYLAGDSWFEGPDWEAAGHQRAGVERKARPEPPVP
ncbi:MAG: DsbA family protein [Burkholderiaceae bacterium]|nr:DsbA family protein [Burkholderiaceae bacterium]